MNSLHFSLEPDCQKDSSCPVTDIVSYNFKHEMAKPFVGLYSLNTISKVLSYK
jgi:hypothetical protein